MVDSNFFVKEANITEKGMINVTNFVSKDDRKIIAIPRKDYIEIWNYNTILKIKEKLEIEYLNACDSSKKDYLKIELRRVNSLLFVFKHNIVLIKGGYKYLYLSTELRKRYSLDDKAKLEGKLGYVRIWNTARFDELDNNKKTRTLSKKV